MWCQTKQTSRSQHRQMLNQKNAKVSEPHPTYEQQTDHTHNRRQRRRGASESAPNRTNLKVSKTRSKNEQDTNHTNNRRQRRRGASELVPNRTNLKVSTSSDVEPKNAKVSEPHPTYGQQTNHTNNRRQRRRGSPELVPNGTNLKVSEPHPTYEQQTDHTNIRRQRRRGASELVPNETNLKVSTSSDVEPNKKEGWAKAHPRILTISRRETRRFLRLGDRPHIGTSYHGSPPFNRATWPSTRSPSGWRQLHAHRSRRSETCERAPCVLPLRVIGRAQKFGRIQIEILIVLSWDARGARIALVVGPFKRPAALFGRVLSPAHAWVGARRATQHRVRRVVADRSPSGCPPRDG